MADPPPPPSPSAPRLETLTACRGIVALMVLFYHASYAILPAPQFWGRSVFGGIFNFHYGRITFFFVVSGFLLGYIHTRDFGQPARFYRYAMSRFRSIYPFYWVMLLVFVLAGLSPIGWSPENFPSPGEVVSSALLVGPDAQSNVLGVAWTLYHEILFYAVFGLLILNRRLGLVAMAIWAALMAAHFVGINFDIVPDYVTRPINLLFLYGYVAAQLVRRNKVAVPELMVLGGVMFILGMIRIQLTEPTDEISQRLLIGIGWAAVIAGLAAIELQRRPRVPRALRQLGTVSYALFLTHYAVLLALAKLAAYFGLTGEIAPEVAFVGMVAAAIAVATVAHHVAERPLSSWMRTAISRRTATRPMVPAE